MDTFSFVVGVVVVWALWSWQKRATNKRRRKSQRQIVRKLADQYQQVLAKKRAQLLVEDDYGDLDYSKWLAEVQRFYDRKVEPELDKIWHKQAEVNISGDEVGQIINDVACRYQEEKRDLFRFDESMEGIEYEHFCADILRRYGWNASVSKASNDQGVDILASKQRLCAAIQCKKYTSPVGNKAVQEVTSGATFHNVDNAVVVSNSSYTTSARQLAGKSGVLLLHHSELGQLDKMLNRK